MESSECAKGAVGVCRVCGDRASGRHYGVASCDGCRGFFKRSVRRDLRYACKERGACVVDVARRNQCQACRLAKCLAVRMRKEAVQHERASRSQPKRRSRHPLVSSSSDPRPPFQGTTTPFCHPDRYRRKSEEEEIAEQQQRPLAPEMGADGAAVADLPSLAQRHPDLAQDDRSSPLSPAPSTTTPAYHHHHRPPPYGGLQQQQQRPLPEPFPYFHPLVEVVSGCGGGGAEEEQAARLLFLSVQWMRGLPAFLQLGFRDRAILLEEAWSDVFVLSAAQWGFPLQQGFPSFAGSLTSPERRPLVSGQLHQMKAVLSQLASQRVDPTEFSCLKALALFRPETVGLRDPSRVELLQDQTQLALHEYVLTRPGLGPTSKVRFGRLLLALSQVRRVSPHVLEEAFFRRTIGSVPIERLLCDMFQASSSSA